MSPEAGLQKYAHRSQSVLALLEANSDIVRKVASPLHAEKRREFYAQCTNTEIAGFGCIDGRTDILKWLKAPYGTCESCRNPGGRFSLGLKFFSKVFESWVDRSLIQGKNCLALVTYHLSSSDPTKGCAAFNHDRDLAYKSAVDFKNEIDHVFRQNGVYAIVLGMETDTQTFILHDWEQKTCFELSRFKSKPLEDIVRLVTSCYAPFPQSLIHDLARLLHRNLNRCIASSDEHLLYHADHREWAICFGRGFDWVDPNSAMIVGPWGHAVDESLVIAATVVLKNIDAGRVSPNEGIALVCQAPYYQAGFDSRNIRLAELHARYLLEFSVEVIKKRVPELFPYIAPIAGTINMNTFQFYPID